MPNYKVVKLTTKEKEVKKLIPAKELIIDRISIVQREDKILIQYSNMDYIIEVPEGDIKNKIYDVFLFVASKIMEKDGLKGNILQYVIEKK